jgi:hypothetical protein
VPVATVATNAAQPMTVSASELSRIIVALIMIPILFRL